LTRRVLQKYVCRQEVAAASGDAKVSFRRERMGHRGFTSWSGDLQEYKYKVCHTGKAGAVPAEAHLLLELNDPSLNAPFTCPSRSLKRLTFGPETGKNPEIR
jgi:hypothetical protein